MVLQIKSICILLFHLVLSKLDSTHIVAAPKSQNISTIGSLLKYMKFKKRRIRKKIHVINLTKESNDKTQTIAKVSLPVHLGKTRAGPGFGPSPKKPERKMPSPSPARPDRRAYKLSPNPA